MTSLRARAVAGGIIWAVFTIIVGVFGLASFLEQQTQARFDELLKNRHTQVVIAVANNADDIEQMWQDLGDPLYQQPFSGEYWQVEGAKGELHVSRSLVDQLLPSADFSERGIIARNFEGPTGNELRALSENLTLDDGSQWNVQVASSLASLEADRALQRGNLLLSFGLIALVGAAGAFFQVTATLQPMKELGAEVLARWDSEDGLDADSYPKEVAPLVTDINTLLERNREIVSRSRRQAADLAHAIKTPSAIMRNELERLRADGMPVDASIDALDRLDAQLKRSFARMRADGGVESMVAFTEVDVSLGRMTRAFQTMASHADKILTTDIEPQLKVRMDQSDFEEVLGNLPDNALKWSKQHIHVSAQQIDNAVEVSIADDGPGIPQDDYGTATLSGQRLDTSKPRTGLGLAIAADIAHAYGGKVKLGKSDNLGGLEAQVILKVSGL